MSLITVISDGERDGVSRARISYSTDLTIHDIMYASTFRVIEFDDEFEEHFERDYNSSDYCGEVFITVNKMPDYEKDTKPNPVQVLLLAYILACDVDQPAGSFCVFDRNRICYEDDDCHPDYCLHKMADLDWIFYDRCRDLAHKLNLINRQFGRTLDKIYTPRDNKETLDRIRNAILADKN